MASRVAVAIEKEDAIKRIDAALALIARQMGEDYEPLPTQGKDADIVTKNQLVHIANAFDRFMGAPIVEALDAASTEGAPSDTNDDQSENTETLPPPDTQGAQAEAKTPASNIDAQIDTLKPKGKSNAKS